MILLSAMLRIPHSRISKDRSKLIILSLCFHFVLLSYF
ncbi:unnamed protein product [Onchocerca flexuosa]|uniref:Uncharacterized protein n=1 Tax=Onchocerca flexuosa TaxID=387005 RepID=A0A183H4A1_9BILA|nr:unnamed protein product [Onchocerca flexuosa]